MNLKNTKDKDTGPIEDTIECVAALARIVKENDLGRLKVSTEDIDIIIEGKRCPPPPPPAPVQMNSVPTAAAISVNDAAERTPDSAGGRYITSPIVGTFYEAPSPDKPPFVKIGDAVNEGDVVCIIESMKLMNEINSELSGKVAEICVKDGDPVEFGQRLMRIE